MFKKLKSLFIIDDETPQKQSPESNSGDVKKQDQGKVPVKIDKPKFDDANPPKGKVDEKFVNRLLGAIEQANLEGFDYLEYKQALQNLTNVEMDEATKYKSALAMAQTMGASSTSLLAAANHYLKILEDEEQKFLEAFKNQRNKMLNNSTDKIKNLESGIKLKNKRIEELKKEIEADTKSLEKMKSVIDNSKAKVEGTKNSFYHAYHIVTKQIKDDVNKMQKYLK